MNKKYKEDIEKNYRSIYNIVDDEVIELNGKKYQLID